MKYDIYLRNTTTNVITSYKKTELSFLIRTLKDIEYKLSKNFTEGNNLNVKHVNKRTYFKPTD